MGILDGLIDDVTNTIGNVVDATSSSKSLTPGFDINTPDSGFFTGVEDAMSSLGGELKSPAFASVNRMKDASTSLNVTDNLDLFTLQQGFGEANANEMWSTLQEVQSFSDSLDECGNYAQDAVKAATTDYIKNTGIQEAGRELAAKIDGIGGGAGGAVDCIAGFATLFDSAGVIDDALGLGDLTQIQSRIGDVIRDATDPSKLSNMLVNLDAVQGLLGDFNDMCTGMKDSLNKLVQADLSALNASLNKLAQWAAFAKIANSDPCALVNNSKLLSHISAPVMDDVVKIYNKVTGQNAGPDNPIIPLGEILGTKPKYPSLPKYTQAAGEGLLSFESFKSSIPGEFTTITDSLTKEAMVLVDGEWVDGITNTSVPLDLVNGEWVENASMKLKSSFTQGIVKGNTPIDDRTQAFSASAAAVSLSAIVKDGGFIEKLPSSIPGASAIIDDTAIKAKVTQASAALATLAGPLGGSGADVVTHLKNKVSKVREDATDSTTFVPQTASPTASPTPKPSAASGAKQPPVSKAFNSKNANVSDAVDALKDVCGCHGATRTIEAAIKDLGELEDFYGRIIEIVLPRIEKDTEAKYKKDLDKWYMTDKVAKMTYDNRVASDIKRREKQESAREANIVVLDSLRAATSGDSSESVCKVLNGVWKCQAVPVGSLSTPKQTKNNSLNTSMPSKSAFDTSKIGG